MHILDLEPLIIHLKTYFEQDWVEEWVNAYLRGETLKISKPLHFKTPFIEKVNLALLEVPFGKTISYKDLANKLGCKCARAIGQALHRNPYPLLLPCHRIVQATGGIGGYAFGVPLKEKLLRFEKLDRT